MFRATNELLAAEPAHYFGHFHHVVVLHQVLEESTFHSLLVSTRWSSSVASPPHEPSSSEPCPGTAPSCWFATDTSISAGCTTPATPDRGTARPTAPSSAASLAFRAISASTALPIAVAGVLRTALLNHTLGQLQRESTAFDVSLDEIFLLHQSPRLATLHLLLHHFRNRCRLSMRGWRERCTSNRFTNTSSSLDFRSESELSHPKRRIPFSGTR